MANRRRYDDKFRASAVVMLDAQGYPKKKGALAAVARHLNVPNTTLHGWYQQKHNPAPTELRTEKKGDLVAMLQTEIANALLEAPQARPEANYRDLITGAAIMIDKLQLLTGNPTDRTEIVNNAKDALISRFGSIAAAEGNKESSQRPN